ncbi:arabinose transporter [Roseomonas elaeocarpi]|uniref:Uncharacterized MFS-type transporter ACFFGY_20435 n=1 Tax=Roseomonas elaeocarpi TaxID=907779 RepID=A0ABV6JYB1_9PROT
MVRASERDVRASGHDVRASEHGVGTPEREVGTPEHDVRASRGDAGGRRLLLLALILFVSYLCVAVSLPVVPLFVTRNLGLGNAWAGLAVGSAFVATILTRGLAGTLSDRRGPKRAAAWGLGFYVAGGLVSAMAGVLAQGWPGFAVLILGRLVVGLGESLVAVGVIAWGIASLGPQRSGKVLALLGASLYGAFAVGGPLGLLLLERLGFAGTMLLAAVLPALGLVAIWPLAGAAAHPEVVRPPFRRVIGRIWRQGSVVCLQGVGFAAIGAFFSLHFAHEGWPMAGLGLTGFGLGFVIVRALFGHLPDRLGGLPVATGSLAVEMAGLLVIAVAGDPRVALLGAFLTGLGCSLVFPAMGREVVRLVEPPLRGTALGAYAGFQDLAYGLTGPLAGLLADRAGYGSVFLAGGISAALGLAVTLRLRRRVVAMV